LRISTCTKFFPDLLEQCSGFSRRDFELLYRLVTPILHDGKELRAQDLLRLIKARIPSKTKSTTEKIETKKWGDIGGYKKEKKLLEQSVVWFYKKRDLFDKLSIRPPIGTLL
jgi:SpoVK/Ycf46/Vps4 family AAA+-type ATPase